MPINPTFDNTGKWWWGYLDDQGVIYVKPYIHDWDIQKVEQLPFCKGIFDPFRANSKHEAQMMIAQWLTEKQYYEKKQNA